MIEWIEYAKIAGAFIGAGGIATLAKLYHDKVVTGKEERGQVYFPTRRPREVAGPGLLFSRIERCPSPHSPVDPPFQLICRTPVEARSRGH